MCYKFPDQGLNSGPLHWKHGVLAIGPPGKSLNQILKLNFLYWLETEGRHTVVDSPQWVLSQSQHCFPLASFLKIFHSRHLGLRIIPKSKMKNFEFPGILGSLLAAPLPWILLGIFFWHSFSQRL